MPFEKGKPKTGGRKKGIGNKDTEFKKALREGIDPHELLAEIRLLERKDQIDRLIRLLEFVYPKMKAVEISGDLELHPITVKEADV